jgi:hypothetical protein
MKTIVSVLVALSVTAGVAGSANALDAKSYYEQFDRGHYAKQIAAFCCETSSCVCSAKEDWTAWGGAMRGLDK